MLLKFGERGTLTGWNNQGRLPERVHMNCSLMQQTFTNRLQSARLREHSSEQFRVLALMGTIFRWKDNKQ